MSSLGDGRPRPVDEVVRRRMSQQRRRDTGPEMSLRLEPHRLGYRYRVDAPLPGLPDAEPTFCSRGAALPSSSTGASGTDAPTTAPTPRTMPSGGAGRSTPTLRVTGGPTRICAQIGWRVLRVWEHEDADAAVQRAVLALDRKPDPSP